MAALLALSAAAACSAPARPTAGGREELQGDMVWPGPPSQPRIRFVQRMARPADLGVRPSFWARVAEFFAGPDEEWLVRPTGVAAEGSRVYVADPGGPALWILHTGGAGVKRIRKADGALLASPVAVAVGADGRIFVADSELGTVFVYDAEGTPAGAIGRAELRRPAGLAYDRARDRLFVAESAAHRIAVFSGDGRSLGSLGQRGSGPGEFNFPTHLALDAQGGLVVSDSLNFRIQRFDADGRFAGAFGHHGDASGEFAGPKGVACDSAGHLYVVEALFDAVQVFDGGGRYLITFGERGPALGQFWLPTGVSIHRDLIYVADSYNRRIQVFEYLRGGPDE